MGSPNTYNARLLEANAAVIPDPGASGTIQVGSNLITLVTLISAGAESRTLAPPIMLGQQITINTQTLAGTITLTIGTVAGTRQTSFNSAGYSAWNSTALVTAGCFVKAEAVMSASGILRWGLIMNPGAAAS